MAVLFDQKIAHAVPDIISRKDAKVSGLKVYYSGKKCPAGHVAERYVSTFSCLACLTARAASPETKEYNRTYRLKHGERLREYDRTRKRVLSLEAVVRRKERDKLKKRDLRKTESYRSKVREYQRTYRAARYRNDDTYKAKMACKNIIQRLVQQNGLLSSSVPYTSDQLKQRIEFQFHGVFAWDTYGKWHIDHKISIARFLERGVTNPAIINALSNLRPLWAAENLSKGRKQMSLEPRNCRRVLAALRSAERALS